MMHTQFFSNTHDLRVMSCRASMSPAPLVEWERRSTSRESWTEPNWESTHAVTSPGSDKLVVPEEKMADHEEQLSDEEKVTRPISPRSELRRGDVNAWISALQSTVSSSGPRRRPTPWKVKEIQASARRLRRLSVFLAQLPLFASHERRLLVRSGLKNRRRGPVIISHKLPPAYHRCFVHLCRLSGASDQVFIRQTSMAACLA